jgi:fructoselysine-6-P-deglycase FrlB-like protein
MLAGCGSQPEVNSPEAMTLIKKFYTAANSKNEKRLADSAAELKELIESQKLSAAEQRAFNEILDLARGGDWDTAQKRALSFAEAQLR